MFELAAELPNLALFDSHQFLTINFISLPLIGWLCFGLYVMLLAAQRENIPNSYYINYRSLIDKGCT